MKKQEIKKEWEELKEKHRARLEDAASPSRSGFAAVALTMGAMNTNMEEMIDFQVKHDLKSLNQ